MQVEKIQKFSKEGTIPIALGEYLKPKLRQFDHFLMKIREYESGLLEKYLDKLGPELDHNKTDIPDVTVTMKLEILGTFPNLLKKSKNCILSLMNYDKYLSQPVSEKITVLVSDYLRGYLFFWHKIIYQLTTMLPKNEVIDLWTEFNDEFITNHPPEVKIDTLDDLLDDMHQFTEMYKGHDCITFKLDAGPVGFKITQCLWFEVMKELEDQDLCHVICCTGDFQTYKMLNPNCELTRPKTIIAGDSHCDFFLIDIRAEKKVEHPSEEFWLKLDDE